MPSCVSVTLSLYNFLNHFVFIVSATSSSVCGIHNAPDSFAGLRRLDTATGTWMEELDIDI